MREREREREAKIKRMIQLKKDQRSIYRVNVIQHKNNQKLRIKGTVILIEIDSKGRERERERERASKIGKKGGREG